MDPLEAVEIETQKGNMTCISVSLSLNLFIDLNHRLATGQQTQGHGLSGEAVHSLVGSSDDTFGLALLPDDQDEMSWLPDWFLSREQHKLPNSRTVLCWL